MAQRNSEKVIIWGDSLAKGVIWNNERRRHGYSRTTAADIVAEKLGVEIVNRAKFGYTAPQGLEMMEHDFESGVTCDTALLEFGGNDCNFDWAAISEHPQERHDPATSPDQFVESMRNMVDWLLKKGVRPMLMTLPPIDSERYFRFLVGDKLSAENILSWLGDVHQIYRFQEMYSLLVEKVARECQIHVLDLRQRCLARRGFLQELICEDGLHLTEEGQRFIGGELADLAQQADAEDAAILGKTALHA